MYFSVLILCCPIFSLPPGVCVSVCVYVCVCVYVHACIWCWKLQETHSLHGRGLFLTKQEANRGKQTATLPPSQPRSPLNQLELKPPYPPSPLSSHETATLTQRMATLKIKCWKRGWNVVVPLPSNLISLSMFDRLFHMFFFPRVATCYVSVSISNPKINLMFDIFQLLGGESCRILGAEESNTHLKAILLLHCCVCGSDGWQPVVCQVCSLF